ncbi:MAG: NAD-dependent epimerase/dehydratase family protein [Natronomonas sp.]
MKLLVTGGSGFIGRRVCRRAIDDGHRVVGVSRRGKPAAEPWADDVEWVAADVFEPETWREHLDGCTAAVHSIGIIEESPTDGVTFERVNGDSAIIAALEAERAGVDRFVFLSSSNTPPLVRAAYIEAKRRAEAAIEDLDMESIVLRPGPVYGPEQPHFPRIINGLLRGLDSIPGVASRFGADRPLPVEAVANAVYAAAVGRLSRPLVDGPRIAARFR